MGSKKRAYAIHGRWVEAVALGQFGKFHSGTKRGNATTAGEFGWAGVERLLEPGHFLKY